LNHIVPSFSFLPSTPFYEPRADRLNITLIVLATAISILLIELRQGTTPEGLRWDTCPNPQDEFLDNNGFAFEKLQLDGNDCDIRDRQEVAESIGGSSLGEVPGVSENGKLVVLLYTAAPSWTDSQLAGQKANI